MKKIGEMHMSLIEEKGIMYTLAKHAVNCKFGSLGNDRQSFYCNYNESKHLEDKICVYESDEIGALRIRLLKLWENDLEAQEYIPVILAAYYKTRNEQRKQLEDMELYNYMM